MQLGLDEDDAVEELLDDRVLVRLVLRADLLLLRLGLAVDRGLDGLRVPGVLQAQNERDGGVVSASAGEMISLAGEGNVPTPRRL